MTDFYLPSFLGWLVCGPAFFFAMPLPRSIIYVDGFNLYHRCLKPHNLQWLDLWAYFSRLRKDDQLLKICYFTALWDGRKAPAQQAYLNALRMSPNVEIVLGKFQTQHIECVVDGCIHGEVRHFFLFKEKRTDVNIALRMQMDATQNNCDQFVLVSGDSDLVPAVRQVRALKKKVVLYVPAREEKEIGANELRQTADMHKTLPMRTLDRAQFPDQIPTTSGMIAKDCNW